jgi:dCMP deaminase
MSIRIPREILFGKIALLVAQRSTCPRKHVGAILVRDNRIISMGYNGSPSGMPHCEDIGCNIGPDNTCMMTVHAEANAIAFAAREGIQTKGSVLYVTAEPCLTCAKLIINAGIIRVVSLSKYKDHAGTILLKDAGIEVWQTEDVNLYEKDFSIPNVQEKGT